MGKHLVVALGLATLLLTGCTQQDEVEAPPNQPKHLEVSQAYKDTLLYKHCKSLGESIEKTRHEKHNITPFKVREDMEVVNIVEKDEYFVVDTKCVVTGYYQVTAINYAEEEYEMPLGQFLMNK